MSVPVSRHRAIHDKRSFRQAIFVTLVHYLCVVSFFTCLAILLIHPDPMSATGPLAGSAVAAVVTWIACYLRRRTVRCPLCKGTFLVDGGAVKHADARRRFPFNHGTTAVLGALLTRRFVCMYCGTPYDLQKPSHAERQRNG